jgi:mono/diheme cytochrome c family protein
VIKMGDRKARSLLLALCALGAAGTVWAQQNAPAPPKVVVVDYDMKKALTPPPLSDVELAGKKLFIQRCALCHDLLGQPATTTVGPWIDGTVVKARGDEAVRQKIMNGSQRMPAWRHTLQPQQIDSVISYLKTVTPEMRPKPGGTPSGPIE